MKIIKTLLALLLLLPSLVFAQNIGGIDNPSSGGGAPSGPAGGDLSGTFPNPNVGSVAHVTTGVLPVPNGGTSCTGPTSNGDSNYSIPSTSCAAVTSATLSATRTWTLPANTIMTAGQTLCVQDNFGGVSSAFNINITAAGSDTINFVSTYNLTNAYQGVCLTADGVSKWKVRNTSGIPSPTMSVTGLNSQAYTYNCTPQNLQWVRQSISNVSSNTAQAFWLFLGDSTTLGDFSFNSLDTTDLFSNNYPTQLGHLLTSAYGVNVNYNGFAGEASSRLSADPRISFTGGWTFNVFNALGGTVFQLGNQSTTDTLSFLPSQQYDTALILYIKGGTGAVFSYKFDSGATTNVNSNGTSGYGIATATASTGIGSHSLKFNYVSGASQSVFIDGIVPYNSAQASVNIINAGWSGATTSQMLTPGNFNAFNGIPVFNQQATFINAGLNDCGTSVSTSTYKTNMQSMITQALTANSGNTNVVLLTFNPTQTYCSQANSQAYIQALYQLAASNNVCLIDNYQRLGSSYTTANNQGFMGNAIHPNQLGYGEIARAIAKVVGQP